MFLTDVWVLTKRSIARIRREPETLSDVTIQPVLFVLMFAYVFGGAIGGLGGGDKYHSYLIGGMLSMTLAQTAPGTAVAIVSDMETGLIDRFSGPPFDTGINRRAYPRTHGEHRGRQFIAFGLSYEVPEQRDISAAQATIAAESRRARTRRVPGADALTAKLRETPGEDAPPEDTAAEETAEPKAAAPKAARKPRAPKAAAAEAGEAEVADAEAAEAEPKPARKPRAPKAAAETAESETAEPETAESETEPKAAAPKAPRKKPAAKPTEPAEQAADDAAEKTADEGDS